MAQAQTLDSTLHAQVHLLARQNANGVTLRWAPDRADAWLQATRSGYRIDRLERDTATGQLTSMTTLADSLRPLAKQLWVAQADARPDARYYNAALQTIHGDWEAAALCTGILGAVSRNDEMANRYSFCLYAADLDAEAAEAAALRYVDQTAQPGRAYTYYVSVNDLPGSLVRIDEGSVTTGGVEQPNPAIVLETGESEGAVRLRWDRVVYSRYYTAYWVERRTPGGTWARLDSVPYIHGQTQDSILMRDYIQYTDSVQNYRVYEYRVIGLDAFAEDGPAAVGVQAMGRDRTPPEAPVDVKTDYLNGQYIVLKWTQPAPAEVTSYRIHRGHEVDQAFDPIAENIAGSARVWLDSTFAPMERNYYTIEALDSAGNGVMSLPVYGIMWDSFPPSPPSDLAGVMDSTGVVTLSWTPSPEIDVIGYKIMMANAADHEYSLITGRAVSGTSFRDTVILNTPTPAVFYKVYAVDHKYNYSELSTPVRVERPDIITPSTPIFRDYRVEDDAVYLTWSPSESSDVAAHRLYRTESGGAEVLLASLSRTAAAYVDSSFAKASTYAYRIEAIDSSGLVSDPTLPLYIVTPAPPPARLAVVLSLRQNEGRPELSWVLPASGVVEQVLLYRAEGDGGLQRIRTFGADELSYTDVSARAGVRYRYAVRTALAGKGLGGFSGVVERE